MNTSTQHTTDYEIETDKLSKKEVEQQKEGLPRYMAKLTLSEDDKKAIVDEVFKEVEYIDAQRKDEQIDENYLMLDNLYNGKMAQNEDLQFNLHLQTTKIKVDRVSNYLTQAFFQVEPRFTISPLPEFMEEGGDEICEKQTDFIDYKVDNIIPLESECKRVFHHCTLKGLAWLKLTHLIRKADRKRKETYTASYEPVLDRAGEVIIDPQSGQPVMKNVGLEDFLNNYPDAVNKYPGLVKRLATAEEGTKINLVVKYKQITYNDVYPVFVPPEKLKVRTSVKNYDDLCEQKWIIEEMEKSWWELKKGEEAGDFYDIDKLIPEVKDARNAEESQNYMFEEYPIYLATGYMKINNEDEYTKLQVWIAKDKKLVIGSMIYPYFAVECNYVPFNIKRKKNTIYEDGLGIDLIDNNIAEDALLNFILEGYWTSSMITPIVRPNSNVASQFLEKRWTHGLPIESDPNEIGFLNNLIKPMDIGGGSHLLAFLKRLDDDISSVSSYTSGRADPIDPDAPAKKTLVLLDQTNINVGEFIKNTLVSFNKVAEIILQIYYQMSEEGLKYRIRPEKVVKGGNPFGTIKRSEMIARTNIQSQATAYNFDKFREKKEDVALYSIIRQEPQIAKRPESVYYLIKTIIKGWSPKWKHRVEQILPPLEDFNKELQAKAVQAVALYMDKVAQQAEMTGQESQVDANALKALIADLQAEEVTPPSEEVQKERAKQENAGR